MKPTPGTYAAMFYSYPYAKIIILFDESDYKERQDYISHVQSIWRNGVRLPHVMGWERW